VEPGRRVFCVEFAENFLLARPRVGHTVPTHSTVCIVAQTAQLLTKLRNNTRITASFPFAPMSASAGAGGGPGKAPKPAAQLPEREPGTQMRFTDFFRRWEATGVVTKPISQVEGSRDAKAKPTAQREAATAGRTTREQVAFEQSEAAGATALAAAGARAGASACEFISTSIGWPPLHHRHPAHQSLRSFSSPCFCSWHGRRPRFVRERGSKVIPRSGASGCQTRAQPHRCSLSN